MAPAVQSWYLLNSGRGNYAFNMALDEALLEWISRLGAPVLRFYAWNGPAASFGYFQKYRDVERATLLRPLVRRPTGGGVVPHDADWTYSLAFPCGHEWYALRAVESYRRIHEWIQAAFSRLQIETELARNPSGARTGQCFIGFEKSDLLRQGQKVAGAAQRRTRTGLLIQGSVQPPPLGVTRTEWELAMCEVASDKGGQWSQLVPNSELRTRAQALTERKYSATAYNQKK